MSKGAKILVNAFIWLVVIVSILFSIDYYFSVSASKNLCTGFEINITDSTDRFVDKNIVNSWIDSLKIDYIGIPIRSLQIDTMESYIRKQAYVGNVDVYTDIRGKCVINLEQRKIVLRLISDKGHDFYTDTSGYILNPSGQWQKDMPIITTDFDVPFGTDDFGFKINILNDTNYYYLQKLSNFVNVISSDEFLRDLITQIRLTGRNIPGKEEIRLVPRLGSQIIVLGNLDDFENKLRRMKTFYLKSFKDGWWQDSKEICFQYGNKVVVKRK